MYTLSATCSLYRDVITLYNVHLVGQEGAM